MNNKYATNDNKVIRNQKITINSFFRGVASSCSSVDSDFLIMKNK